MCEQIDEKICENSYEKIYEKSMKISEKLILKKSIYSKKPTCLDVRRRRKKWKRGYRTLEKIRILGIG